MEYKCGYIAILGRPNAGKSTLVNNLVGEFNKAVNDKSSELLDKITNTYYDCLEELYAGCSNIISDTVTCSMNGYLSQQKLLESHFDFIPIHSCVWKNKNITSFKNLFKGCSNIRNISCGNKNHNSTITNISNITDVSYMFCDCCNKPIKRRMIVLQNISQKSV